MKRLIGFTDRDAYRGGMLSIGNFDGVHRGHRAIVERLVQSAGDAGVPAVVLTFEPHPATLLAPERVPPRLTTATHKAELLGRLGVATVLEYPTDRRLLDLTPEEFFERIVLGEIAARGLVEGPNFFFGRNRAGDVALLREMCGRTGLFFESLAATETDEGMVSSSAIRRHLAEGNVAAAARMLGRLHSVAGIVTSGAGRGRRLKFPTANLTGIETLLPAPGVYAAFASFGETQRAAAVHIGPNPTFGEATSKVEAHLLDFSGDLYRQTLRLEFMERIRDVRPFPSLDDLKRQLESDVARCAAVTSEISKRTDDA